MEIGRTPAGLPPMARDETAQRVRQGGGGTVGGDPGAERHAAAERQATDQAASRASGQQTTEAVGRTAQPDLGEAAREAATPRASMERGARLDLKI